MQPAYGLHDAVVSPHHLASSVGLQILKDGGSAVDAAIATNAALGVVFGSACGIGGDAFWLIWGPSDSRLVGLNGSGRSGKAASATALRDLGLQAMPLRGGLSITVPGAVRSWGDAHARFGRLPRSALLERAIELAADGFPAWDGFIEAVERSAPIFQTALGSEADWFRIYRPDNRPWRHGERVCLPALAGTLKRIADHGWQEFYEGDTAELASRALTAAGSSLGIDDLRVHASTWTEPISTDYRGTRVAGHRPNSQGFVALEILNILEQFEPPTARVFKNHMGADLRWTHLGIEAAKLALADRDQYLTDPDVAPVPLDWLLSRDHAAKLATMIDPQKARIPSARRVPVGGGTVWLGVVDESGCAVSLIQSNYMTFGSGVVDPATGVVFQNRGSFFSLDPNMANVLAPSKRTLHTLMPGMLLRNGQPWLVVGSMGGDAQPQIHAQVVSAVLDGGLDVASAVTMPRWFVEPKAPLAPPATVRAEPRFRPGLIRGLEGLGHEVTRTAPFDNLLGHCHGIALIDGGPAQGGTLAAATDPRSAGLPAVW
jgi:gamma-glutamyltranspeptidase/glutathione hydrolase